ncbi:hypothetical protein Tco_0512632 [Tanacetum coccineum]
MMMKSKSYNKHPAHRAMYDALVQSLIVDKDDMDKQLEDQSTPKKRRQDDNDQYPSAQGKSLSKSSKTDKSVHADVTVHDVEMEAGESLEDDVVDDENPTQANASAPKQDKSTWFKTVVVERLESPDPEWHKEPTVDDALE